MLIILINGIYLCLKVLYVLWLVKLVWVLKLDVNKNIICINNGVSVKV